ncbi:hypothetical protein DLP05_086 [Stenotrophomonas phage vB_SmaS_DLP_5]|uniref:Uncharacterized protein n=1 Tax=Stenotrophomonas phage vB_SmaS_DLP_5 TaxID=2044561 RepID=A0A2D2W2J7_9CAUD|nr:hypothetical protein FDJ07_gp135 [Stenotrophomonas phage vB_SmaS_DLP_5]ATS92361.1 hypothetical protein DLP05_086 [Stenotrophomonas phage vB_SmaS_DLP_5]
MNLIEQLRDGPVCHAKRWSGDTHDDLGGTVNESATIELMNRAADALESRKVFAFVHSSCKYEESPYVVSLHTTKAGAWRAMYEHRYAHEVLNRDYYLLHGGNYSPMHAGLMMIWAVRQYEVKP